MLKNYKPVIGVCSKCGQTRLIIRHHLKYGVDEQTVFMCRPCHNSLHHLIRREGKCPHTRAEAHRLSSLSSHKYWHKDIKFSEMIEPNIQLREIIRYNTHNGGVYVGVYFEPTNKAKLLEIDDLAFQYIRVSTEPEHRKTNYSNRFLSSETLISNVYLKEELVYNQSGTLRCNGYFVAGHGKKLIEVVV